MGRQTAANDHLVYYIYIYIYMFIIKAYSIMYVAIAIQVISILMNTSTVGRVNFH